MIDREENPDLFATPGKADSPAIAQAESTAPVTTTLGARLRAAREARGLYVATCGSRLHLPIKVLERLEAGDSGVA